MDRADVIVIGAGLSGLACAFELASAGLGIMLLEAKPHVGGRTASWCSNGMPVESGFHRFRGIYRALPALLARAGIDVDAIVEWQSTVELRSSQHPPGTFGIAPVIAPAQTLRGVFGNTRLLSARDKLSLLSLLAFGIAAHTWRGQRLDRRNVLEYATARGITRRALERVVLPLTRGVFFRAPRDYSAYAFMMPLAYSLRRLLRMRSGVFRGGMTHVMAQPLASAVAQRGGIIRVGAPVRRLIIERKSVKGVELENETISARHVVVATSLGSAKTLLQPLAAEPSLARLWALPTTPALTLQIDMDRPALAHNHPVFAPGTSLMCFAEQSRTTFAGRDGRLSIVLSPPEGLIHLAHDALLEHVMQDAASIGIELAGHVRDYRVIAMTEDFYSAAPGNDALRPDQTTSIQGLTLSGDYTRQPFLSTMEGAVLAGQRAARAVQLGIRAQN